MGSVNVHPRTPDIDLTPFDQQSAPTQIKVALQEPDTTRVGLSASSSPDGSGVLWQLYDLDPEMMIEIRDALVQQANHLAATGVEDPEALDHHVQRLRRINVLVQAAEHACSIPPRWSSDQQRGGRSLGGLVGGTT